MSEALHRRLQQQAEGWADWAGTGPRTVRVHTCVGVIYVPVFYRSWGQSGLECVAAVLSSVWILMWYRFYDVKTLRGITQKSDKLKGEMKA